MLGLVYCCFNNVQQAIYNGTTLVPLYIANDRV